MAERLTIGEFLWMLSEAGPSQIGGLVGWAGVLGQLGLEGMKSIRSTLAGKTSKVHLVATRYKMCHVGPDKHLHLVATRFYNSVAKRH
jgi:hypothetical protein